MKALVAGSAHLDILARPLNDSAHRDRIGRVTIEAGGTACNVAFDLRKLGVHVRLLTAWGTSAIERLMANHIESTGVELMADEVAGMPLAAFCAQLTFNGDLGSAISSTPVDTHHFEQERIDAALAGVDYVILDANLSANTIEAIALRAKERGMTVFALAVSEDKVERLRPAAHLLDAIFMNSAESERLMALAGAADPSELAEILKVTLFVTRGDRGAVVYFCDGERSRIQPPALNEIGNLLGVGDAFSVGIIDGLTRLQLDYSLAAQRAHNLVKEIARSDACNAYSLNALNNMVGVLYADARNDKLTGLLRRAAFEHEFGRFEKGWMNSLIVIDCDRFKKVNDTLGHHAGDEVLQRLGKIIQAGIRAGDIPSRWGGDEFVVLLPRTSQAEAHQVAERIRVAAAAADLHGVTLSIGIATSNHADSLKSLLERADASMYRAKHAGRNMVVAA